MVGNVDPITVQAMQTDPRAARRHKLLPPARSEVERDLSNGPVLIAGMEKLFEQYNPEGWREPFARVREQLTTYEQFIRTEVLPKARTDFRLPATCMRSSSNRWASDWNRNRYAKLAHEAFAQIQGEMQRLAPKVAAARGLKTTDYRDVIRALKKEQLVGDAILPHYRKRLEDIEAIVRKEKLVTLPERAARIRIATDARGGADAGAEHAAAATARQHRRTRRIRPAAERPGCTGRRSGARDTSTTSPSRLPRGR